MPYKSFLTLQQKIKTIFEDTHIDRNKSYSLQKQTIINPQTNANFYQHKISLVKDQNIGTFLSSNIYEFTLVNFQTDLIPFSKIIKTFTPEDSDVHIATSGSTLIYGKTEIVDERQVFWKELDTNTVLLHFTSASKFFVNTTIFNMDLIINPIKQYYNPQTQKL